MAYLVATDQPIYFAVEYQGAIVIASLTEVGGKTGIPPTLTEYHDTDENAYLGKVSGKVTNYDPLPDVGEWVEAGKIYGYNDGLVIVRQSHFRTIYPPEQTPALFVVYRENQTGVLLWIAGEQVQVGTHRLYLGTEYVCLQAHVTQSDWTPPVVPALWRVYVPTPPTNEWAAGVAYKIGDIVTYLGLRYQCRQSHTSQIGWEPPNVLALWLPL